MLCAHSLLARTDVATMVYDEALYDICRRHLDLAWHTHTNINRLLAQITSSLTASLRFDGAHGKDATHP